MGSGTIVIIDDEPDSRRYLSDLLSGEGYRVRAFESPYVALTYIYEARPDVILLDLRIPQIDGMTLLPALRAVSSDTAVILLTAYGSRELFEQAGQKGACETLNKPVHPATLLDSIARCLGRERKPF